MNTILGRGVAACLTLSLFSSAVAEEGETSVAQLIEQLSSTDTQERREAAYALAELGPAAKEAVPALTERLQDEDPWVRRVAADALDEIGSAEEEEIKRP